MNRKLVAHWLDIGGTKPIKTRSPSENKEYKEQIQVIKWKSDMLRHNQYPELRLLWSNNNTQKLTDRQSQRWKLNGGVSGVPDLTLAVVRGKFHGLYIEMKNPDKKPKKLTSKGGLSDEQIEKITLLREQGYYVEVCYCANDAINLIEKYLKGQL